MNHFHLSIKFNMGEVLYSLIIAVVVGLVYFTSVDGHVLRCKYFFYICFFLICTQKVNNVIYNELFSDDQVLKRVAIVHVHQHMYCEISFIRGSQWSWLAKTFLVCRDRLSLTRGCATQSLSLRIVYTYVNAGTSIPFKEMIGMQYIIGQIS